jgi:non-specific serine/threonine protein kinase
VLAVARSEQVPWGSAEALNGLARTGAARGDHDRAVRLFQEELPARAGIDDRVGQMYTIEGLARSVAALGQAERAATLLRAVTELQARLGMARPTVSAAFSARDAAVDAARAALGDAAFEAAFARGRRLSRTEAIELALRDDASAHTSASASATPVRLT